MRQFYVENKCTNSDRLICTDTSSGSMDWNNLGLTTNNVGVESQWGGGGGAAEYICM